MIIGTGIDIIELERIQMLIEQQARFAERILTAEELSYWSPLVPKRKVEFLAGRFAAKEALAKALGTGIGKQFTWHDVSILAEQSGAPNIQWTEDKQEQYRTYQFFLSISHSLHYAVAQVIIQKNK